jgi:rod shape-determining protein MreD
MRALVICFLTYVAFVLRTVLPLAGEWGPFLPRVDLALLLVIVCRTGGMTGLLTAAAWGLISDALSRGALGIDVLTFVLVAYGTQLLAARGWMQSPLAGSVVTGTAVFVTAVASSLLRFGADQPLDPSELVTTAGGPALTTAIFVFVLCEIWRWIVGRPASGPSASSAQVANRWHMLTE